MSSVKLNSTQRAAVEHGEGPLLIVAGAGTGKTRVIVERVGYLLKTVPGLQPENILAVTYTEKAAGEMRQRAKERFGEVASRCRFSTIHAFCYGLLAESVPGRALDPTDQWIFLRRHLEELELEHYFKTSEPGRYLADLVDFCSRCHDNLVSPAEYTAYIEKLAANCAGASAKQPEFDEENLARQIEVGRVFRLLEQLQEKQGLLSFGAMISHAVRLLDEAPERLAQLQRQYQFILVDEFQDINTAQFELLARLAGERRNLTVVGDDDQAIYRFRGASYASFQQFAERFPEHARIVLDRNYRSTKHILAVAGTAITANSQDRYMPGKKLITDEEAGPGVEIWEFADDMEQAEYTAQWIGESLHRGEAKSFSEFAVLYRAHNHRNRLVEALQRRGIPFEIRRLAINNHPLVRDLVAALRVIADPRDSVSLVRLLADPRWNTPPELLQQCCRDASSQRKSLWEVVEQGMFPAQWQRRELLLDFRRRFNTLAEKERLPAWLPLLCAEMGWPHTSEERPAFQTFTEFVARWDQEKSSTGLLAEFLEYFQYFEEAGGILALGEGGGAYPAGAIAGGGQKELWEESSEEEARGKVQLMTVHAAKGLEFERVFVWHLVRRAFPTYHRRPLIELPPALWKGPLPRGDFHVEEERRLFYVALTRARRSLVLSTLSNLKQRPSIFVDQLQEIPPPTLVRKRPVYVPPSPLEKPAGNGAPEADGASSRLAGWFSKPLPPPDKELTLSISQLETYEQCPLKYYFGQYWRVPVPPPPPLLFGTVVHAALKEVMTAVVQGQGAIPEETIREILERHWPESGFADKLQEHKYRKLGVEQLTGAVAEWSNKGIVLLFQEKPFELRRARCRLVGRIDQLQRVPGGGVELVEFKTGRSQSQKEADRSQQITLYAEACRRVLGLEPAALILYNLTNQETIRTERSAKQYRELERKIQETAQQILEGRFSPRPGYHCRFCSFRAICPSQEEGRRGGGVSELGTNAP